MRYNQLSHNRAPRIELLSLFLSVESLTLLCVECRGSSSASAKNGKRPLTCAHTHTNTQKHKAPQQRARQRLLSVTFKHLKTLVAQWMHCTMSHMSYTAAGIYYKCRSFFVMKRISVVDDVEDRKWFTVEMENIHETSDSYLVVWSCSQGSSVF